jgi:hypothetical protein
MPLAPEAQAIFKKYYDTKKYSVHGRVVQHPRVPEGGRGFSFCTCTLQRAVVVWDNGEEQLWVRSRFRSAFATDARKFVNFAPEQPTKFTFKSAKIWFPLALNEVLPEKGVAAYLLLDVLTKNELKVAGKQLAKDFSYDSGKWYVTRISRTYLRGQPVDDLEIDAAPPKAP